MTTQQRKDLATVRKVAKKYGITIGVDLKDDWYWVEHKKSGWDGGGNCISFGEILITIDECICCITMGRKKGLWLKEYGWTKKYYDTIKDEDLKDE